MIVSDRVSSCTQKQSSVLKSSDGEDEANGKEGDTVDIVPDCKAFVFHCD